MSLPTWQVWQWGGQLWSVGDELWEHSLVEGFDTGGYIGVEIFYT